MEKRIFSVLNAALFLILTSFALPSFSNAGEGVFLAKRSQDSGNIPSHYIIPSKVVVQKIDLGSHVSSVDEEVNSEALLFMFMESINTGKYDAALEAARSNPVSFGNACYKALNMVNDAATGGRLKKQLLKLTEVMTKEFMDQTGEGYYYETFAKMKAVASSND